MSDTRPKLTEEAFLKVICETNPLLTRSITALLLTSKEQHKAITALLQEPLSIARQLVALHCSQRIQN